MQVSLGILLVAGSAFSQAQMSSGNVKGTVADPSGAVVAGAAVVLTNIDTGVDRSGTTDSVGEFRFFVLSPGSYELKITSAGFATLTHRAVQVTVGQTVILDAKLEPAALQQEVLVQEVLPTVEPEKTQQSDTITEERIDNLPINERNFLNFSMLTPGVTDANGLVTFSLPQTTASGLSFLGQGGRSNSVTIDGVDNNDNAVGAVRSTVSQEAVREFQINRSNYNAEFGRASGGLINIVSKSGTNAWNGDVFAFIRDQSLDARNPFAFGPGGSNIDPPYSRQQAGFTLSGPVKKGRTFFFLSYEGLRQRESRFVTFLENTNVLQPTASQKTLIAALAANPSAMLRAIGTTLGNALTTSDQTFPDTMKLLRSDSGVFPFRNNDNTASLRLDHSISESSQVFGRLTFTDIDTVGSAFGGLRGPSRGTRRQVQDYAAVFGETHFFNARRVNEFRFQFANRDFDVYPADPYGPEITINGVAAVGRDFFLPSTRNEKRYQWVDNYTSVVGSHELKFGGDFNYVPFRTTTEVFRGGRFIFGEAVPLALVIDNIAGAGTTAGIASGLAAAGRADVIPNLSAPINSLQAFNFGLPIVYQQGFGNPRADFTNKILSGYVQDTFRVRSNVVFNLGLRYDREFQPSPLHRDKNNWGPRFGFSYSRDPKTVVRGGYGVFYSPLFEAIAFVGRVLNGTQIQQVFVPLTGLRELGVTATSALVWELAKQQNVFGNRSITVNDIARLGLQPGLTPPVLLDADPGIVSPYSQQFSLGIDREFPGAFTVGVNYLGNRGVKVVRSRNVNLRQVGTNAYGALFGPMNPRILQNNRVESSGSTIYHGLTLSASKRYRNSQVQLAYTYSKAIDDTTDFITDLQPANQLNLRAERGLSSFDQRHRLVVNSVLSVPWDVTVSPIFTYSTGHPFNLLLGFDANNDTNANTDRPLFAGRNTGIGPDFVSVDIRVSKTFPIRRESPRRLEAIFEAFNLFNRINFSGLNTVVGNTPLPSYRVRGRRDVAPTDPLGFTSAFDPRQIQLGLKFFF
jgi:Carboxypeptidase regulatory-like domain/TonB dependent receptor